MSRKKYLLTGVALAIIASPLLWRVTRVTRSPQYRFEPLTLTANLRSIEAPLRIPSVRLSESKTYLVDGSGKPFFINGDAAWSLIAQISREDAEVYLENRRE